MNDTETQQEIERLTAERDRLRRAGKFQRAQRVTRQIEDLTDPEEER